MKTLKITALALFLAITNLVCGQQQGGKSPEERAAKKTQELTEKLSLTADQQKTVSAAALTHAKQNEADREKYKGDKEGMKAARKASAETFEQKTKWEQIKQDEKAKRQQGGGGQRGGE
jgi:CHASE1-domain containing sensor protein